MNNLEILHLTMSFGIEGNIHLMSLGDIFQLTTASEDHCKTQKPSTEGKRRVKHQTPSPTGIICLYKQKWMLKMSERLIRMQFISPAASMEEDRELSPSLGHGKCYQEYSRAR